ncbi:hypothetical protein LU640_05030 [Pseudomonas monteilii]|uniref:hypothetical protein n=1 Tax=Pseudomonas monteilii TaxID=76759 RepID=UPI001E40EBBB|nr:hypothetical protein [Pseudomonas monteilii]MCE1016644.1 hypothetical protein [Pseudomonas monteilii]MCE1033877.1 hypothetical protein [Pseudomonas monteilii]MCE1086017.1 hypothetical protein [Pseudomonas monteilii]
MSNAKIARLLELLIERTESGELEWEPTVKSDVFQANFPRYSVRILTTEAEIDIDIVLQIINEEGLVVESVRDPQLNGFVESAFLKMRALHESARRIAMGVDKALDEIIDFLEPDIPF